MSGIVGDCHTLLLSACMDNIISQSLRRTLYNILVHTVRAGTDNTAQSGCTKLKRRIITLPNLFIIILNRFQIRSRPLVEIRIIQPFIICFSLPLLPLLYRIIRSCPYNHHPLQETRRYGNYTMIPHKKKLSFVNFYTIFRIAETSISHRQELL